MKERLRRCWAWLADENNRGRVGTIAAVAVPLIALLGIVISINPPSSPPPSGGEVRLSLEDFEARLEKRAQEVEQRLASAHGEERARLENELAEVKRQLSDIDPAHADALKQIGELEAALARLGDDISDKQLVEIRVAIEAGDFSKADALLAEIEDRTDVAVVRAAEAAFQRGKIAVIQIKWDKAATHFDKAARLNPTYDHLNEAGLFAKRAARHKTALYHFEKLLGLSRREYGERAPATATVLNNLAALLQETGRYTEAEPLYRQALEIGRETLGEKHPDYAIWLNNLANLFHATGRYTEAEPLYRQALKIGRETLGEKHPDDTTRLNNLAALLEATGRYTEAEPLYRQALEIDREMLGEKHPRYATRLNNLAGLLAVTDRYAEAEPLYRQALEIVQASLGDDHPNTKRMARNYAQLLRTQFPDHPALAELNAVFGGSVDNN